jgi:hypothetical protein
MMPGEERPLLPPIPNREDASEAVIDLRQPADGEGDTEDGDD